MKTHLLLLAISVASASAQFTLDWSTMDGGGGSGTAGTFSMRSTFGQIDAFSTIGKDLTIDGGFWSIPDDEAPALRIFLRDRLVVLAWPDPSPGFTLQASPNLLTGAWLDVSIAPTIVDKERQVTWGTPAGAYFFRLHRP